MKTMKGNKVTVLGNELQIGDKAPSFTLTDNNLEDVSLEQFKDEFLLLSAVPSLDTSVCDFQTREINQKLANNPKVKFITISMDLPFAQKRWCGANGLDVLTLSDHKTAQFGKDYGLLIKELRLLGRAVIVLDQNRNVIYKEYLNEMGNHPNYDELLSFIKNL